MHLSLAIFAISLLMFPFAYLLILKLTIYYSNRLESNIFADIDKANYSNASTFIALTLTKMARLFNKQFVSTEIHRNIDNKTYKILFRPLENTQKDILKLAVFFESLSSNTRNMWRVSSYDIDTAKEYCHAINKYDKLRMIMECIDNHAIIGIFEFSFDLVQDDIDRYQSNGITLNQQTDVRYGVCISDKYQGLGLATQGFRYMKHIAYLFQQKRIILWGGTYVNNSKAIKHYERLGFHRLDSYRDSDGNESYDMILVIN